MSDIRELRLAIERKLKERRHYMDRAAAEARRADSLERERDTLEMVAKSKMMQFAIEDCADQIVRDILDKALEASRIVANESIDNGDYEIGIDIPSLHIRQRLFRSSVIDFLGGDQAFEDRPIKRINVNLNKDWY